MDICLDSEQLRVLTYAIKTFPAHGSLSSFDKDSGAVTYTSNRGYTDLIVSPFLPVMEYQQEKAQDLAVVVFIIISIAAIFTISSVFVNIFLSKSSSHRSTKLSSHLYFAPSPTPSGPGCGTNLT